MNAFDDGKPLKGLVLAAGLGTRLRPLTLTLPKPLATVCGTTLLDAAIDRLMKAGASELAINSFHLPDVLRRHVNDISSRIFQMMPHISLESPAILGTGGALIPLRPWWGDSRLLVYNGDILSDMDLGQLVAAHKASSSLVTMAVRKTDGSESGRSVWVNSDGYVQIICKREDLPSKFRGLNEYGYACAYVAEAELSAYLPDQVREFDLIEGFNKALSAGMLIKAEKFGGIWADIGTPKSLWETNLMVARLPEHERQSLLGRASVSGNCHIFKNNVLNPLCNDLDPHGLDGCVFLGDAVIRPGERLKNHLRGFGFDVSF